MRNERTGISRRSFLKSSTSIAAGLALPAWFVQREEALAVPAKTLSPNDRPGIALIGCGGQGRGVAQLAALFGDMLAVCDVDDKRRAAGEQAFTRDGKTPALYKDFRDVMARDDIHVIINGTPDHWHTLINIAAMKSGKDVYSEKPLTLTIDEGKHLVEASRKTKRILQTGSQQRSDPRFHLACELVRNGRLGRLRHITVGLPEGARGGPFNPVPEIPLQLDWDFWQGQTAFVPYIPQRCHGTFRYWWDYSGGTMTDWGAHHNDIAQWANGTERSGPVEVDGRALVEVIPGGYTAASQYRVEFKYANGVTLTSASNAGFNGLKFEGERGWIYVDRSKIEANQPELISEPLPANALRLYRVVGKDLKGRISWHDTDNHMRNFFDCVRSRKQPICEAEIGHRSASVCHLGVISVRLGRKLKWDPKQERFIGDDEANGMVARRMREPYSYSIC
jgi:predicted dehydrogenase